jgi:glycosyltransferase involved in cell wall biosynthesis
MKISIALAAYDGQAYLPAQLQSFVAQTRQPDEVIVVDDRSRDGTAALVAEFARTAPFDVRLVVNDQNLGHGQNFSKALALCTGDLVFLSDQDDVWFDDKIERMAALATRRPEMLCFMNDCLLADAGLQSEGVTKQQQIRAAGLPETSFVMGCCTAIRRDFLNIVLPVPPTIHAHDTWMIGIADGLGRTCRHDEALQYYRRHGANVSNLRVNSTGRVNPLRARLGNVLDRVGRINSGQVLDFEYRLYTALVDRLATRGPALAALVGAPVLAAYQARVEARQAVLATRAGIRRRPRHRRLLAIARLYRQGGYAASSGLLGAIKDFIIGRA